MPSGVGLSGRELARVSKTKKERAQSESAAATIMFSIYWSRRSAAESPENPARSLVRAASMFQFVGRGAIRSVPGLPSAAIAGQWRLAGQPERKARSPAVWRRARNRTLTAKLHIFGATSIPCWITPAKIV
jgi:hypothetical protein